MSRLKVGLTFLYSYRSWAGGVIYRLNIIGALNMLDDALKPEILLYYNDEAPIEDVKQINYPYIKYFKFDQYPPPIYKKALNYLYIKLFNSTYFFDDKPDLLYPYIKYLSYGKRPLFWIPDFQEYYFPELFTKKGIATRVKRHKLIAGKKDGIVVFSSQDALNDFEKFYPKHLCQKALLRFACILPEFEHLSLTSLKEKFGITTKYFMVTNQFWTHKNHKVIFEALQILKEKDLDFRIALTGSTQDKRNPEFFNTLLDYVKENQLEKYLIFLGFIGRDEQLKLISGAEAIIQPSLFEGWSTVVEEAKALDQHIILSDINVHKEQIAQNCSFFSPTDPAQLAQAICNILDNKPEIVKTDYTKNIESFGKEFLNVIALGLK